MDVGARTKRKVAKRAKPEIITTMSIDSFKCSDDHPQPERQDVCLQDDGTKEYTNRVCEGILKDMSVLDGPAVRSLVLVMHLMHPLVEELSV